MDASYISALVGSMATGATAGLRVFLPLFLLSLSVADIIPLGLKQEDLPDTLAWLGSSYAAIGFGVGYALERLSYFIPIVDNVVDFLELFLAPLAGALLSIATIGHSDPSELTSGAIYVSTASGGGNFPIALVGFIGGSLALTLHASLIILRWVSTAITAGCANPVISFFEDVAAAAVFILALIAGFVAFILLTVVVFFAIYRAGKALASKRASRFEPHEPPN